MIFLGTTFCSGRRSLLSPTTSLEEITAIQIFDGKYNQLFLSTDSTLTVYNYDEEWTQNTLMNATFEDTLDAGNSGFGLSTTDHIVIKRRELGALEWVIIYVKEINTVADFQINIKDTYARAGVEYEYCVSSFIGGVENNYVIKNVYSDFDGYYITDKDCLYGTIYDLDGCDTSRNMTAQTLELLNSKYMTVVSNSSVNCDSGSITGTFLKTGENSSVLDLNASIQYRNDFKNRLVNRKPLILKIFDGRIWMIRVSGNITDSQGDHPDIRKITFDWVEIGDVNDMKTLYETGLSDVDSRWW